MSLQNSNRYQIEKQIGVGGMGKVYKAYDSKLSRFVAIKVMIDSEANEQTKERFRREIEAIAKLRHPNIVQLYDVGEEKGMPYFTMDYIEGGDLSHIIKQQKKISSKKAAEIMSKVSDALFHAHEQGIIHRDLKPSNIMISQGGEPILMDFGLAKVGKESKLTKTGTVMGTFSYMSPEQADGKLKEIDERSDIYSLGTLFYEMLTGFVPFRGSSTVEIITKISRETPKKPSTVNIRVDKNIERVCLQAMAKDKRKRYQTAKELCEDLQRYLNKKPVLAKSPSYISFAWLEKNKEILALNALALAVFFMYIWFFWADTSINEELPQKDILKPKSTKKSSVIPMIKKRKLKKYKETKIAGLEFKKRKILQDRLQIKLKHVTIHPKRKNALIFFRNMASQLHIFFRLDKKPQKTFLRIKHLASRNKKAKKRKFAPINIKLNDKDIRKDYNPGGRYTQREYEITSEVKVGENILWIQLGAKATSTYCLAKLYVIAKEER